MARINKFETEFVVVTNNGELQRFTARFQHQHASEGRQLMSPPGVDSKGRPLQPIPVQHMTTCLLTKEGVSAQVRGVSYTSLKDKYRWRAGVRLAFMRALESAGWVELKKDRVTGRIVAKPQSELYGLCMESFFEALREKVPARGQRSTATSAATTAVPVENRQGLAYAGMD